MYEGETKGAKSMKKILCLLICVILCTTLVGCTYEPEIESDSDLGSRFIVVDSFDEDECHYWIHVDKETNVMYLEHKRNYNYGVTFTVMLDSDGKPLLWEENKNVTHLSETSER